MRVNGRCPHCGETFESPVVPAASGTCVACGGEYLVAVPEGDPGEGADSPEAIELVLLPQRPSARPRFLQRHGLRRPLFWMLACGGLLVFTLFLLGLCFLFAPDTRFTRLCAAAVANGLVLIPAAAALLAPVGVLWRVARRERRPARGFALKRSAGAVAAATASLVLLGLLVVAARPLLGLDDDAPRALLLTFALVADTSACLVAGWLAARLAPSAPYLHALCVSGVLLVGGLAVTLPSSLDLRIAELTLSFLAYLPPLLLGAWTECAGRRPTPRAAGAVGCSRCLAGRLRTSGAGSCPHCRSIESKPRAA